MTYTGYELLWLFFVYSFLGWILETVTAALKKKRFINRGLVNGPLCVIYGVAAILITLFLNELHGLWLFFAITILTTVLEWIAGRLIEILYQERWWDYSNLPFNLDGYICLPVSLLWGALGMVGMLWGNELFSRLFHLIPMLVGKTILLVLLVVLLVDILATLILISGKSQKLEQWEEVDNWFTNFNLRLGRGIYRYVNRRMERAYEREKCSEVTEEKLTVFAYGCSFYKIVLLFVIGSLLGDITETIFCRIRAGIWMSRSSLVWGPFSIVWGFAIAAATLLLDKYKERSDRFLFFFGTFLGGLYEYVCSVMTELFFGKVFWDYSQIPFNLGGRINLLYCFFWGIAAVVWIKGLYPILSRWIEKIPMKWGKIITWLLIVFMSVNMAVSALALIRSDQRADGIPAQASWQKMMDQYFNDEKLKKIYPNALNVD